MYLTRGTCGIMTESDKPEIRCASDPNKQQCPLKPKIKSRTETFAVGEAPETREEEKSERARKRTKTKNERYRQPIETINPH